MAPLADAHGGSLLALWLHGLRDRMAGAHERADARWGWVEVPPGRGRLVWVRTGGSLEALRVAAELTAALHARRPRLRLALTYEREHPGFAPAALAASRRVMLGHGPADAPLAVRRALARLRPSLVLSVGRPRPNLAYLLAEASVPLAVVAGGPPRAGTAALAWPATAAEAAAWRETGGNARVLPPADPAVLLARPPASHAADAAPAYWLHGLEADEARALTRAWRRSALAGEAELWLGAAGPAEGAALAAALGAPLTHGEGVTVREGLAVSTDPAGPAAVAARLVAVHLERADALVAWRALAAGVPVSAGLEARRELDVLRAPGVRALADAHEALAWWAELRLHPEQGREAGERAAQRYRQERARAEANLEALVALAEAA